MNQLHLSSIPKPPKGSFAQEVARLLADPATSDWLSGALNGLDARDPVDALGDVETLRVLTLIRLREVLP